MTKIALIISGIVLMGLTSCNQQAHKQNGNSIRFGGIEFMDTIHHFGEIRMESPVDSFDFKFVNKSERLLVILDARTSCHCTKVDFLRKPIQPGDTSFIRVTYDGTGRTAEHFNKSVTIYTNVADKMINLRIDGYLK